VDSIKSLFEFLLHLDQHLNVLIGPTVYYILFLIIFCETGLVVFPFLPGDSLLFALGAFAATGVGGLKLQLLLIVLWLAAMIGDSTNYWIGYFTGVEIFDKQKIRFIKKEHLERAHRFYEKHGGKTVTIARFLPIIRTFAPFVAGISRMKYSRFLIYSICGSLGWVSIFILGGYFFGNLPLIKQNFTLVIAAIILISLIPATFEFIHQRQQNLKKNRTLRIY
jgi:membrane-associated protein